MFGVLSVLLLSAAAVLAAPQYKDGVINVHLVPHTCVRC